MRCDASRSMRAMPRPSSSFETRARAFEFAKRLGIRAPQDEDEHRVLQSSPYKQPFSFPRRFRRGTRWLVRSLYFPVFLQIRNLPSPVSRSQAHTHLLVPAAHFCDRGFATLLHSPRIEGGAERRETFGCSAEHPWGLQMTRQARRLRGALRAMRQQYTGRNNVT